MPKLKAQAVDSYADFASLPAPVAGIYEIAVTEDDGQLYISDGIVWTAAGGGGGNVDGGVANSVYGGSNTIDGGNA